MAVYRQRIFGTGQLVFQSGTANSTPVPVASLQDVKLTIKGDTVELMGPYRLAEDLALGKLSIEGTYKGGSVRSGLLATALPGATTTTGMVRAVSQEGTGTISGATYTLTHATSPVVLGVYNENGVLMDPIGSSPTATQYIFNSSTGVFTFNTGANGKVYTVDYLYADAANGWTVDWDNQLQGTAATLSMYLMNKTNGKEYGCKLWSVLMPELTIAMKIGEFALPEGSFKAFADSSGNVATFYGE